MSGLNREKLSSRPIGVFDSGLGGLTVVKELSAIMPAEDIVYLGDSARVPYGIKSLATVQRFAMEDATFLLGLNPKLLVVACNTASAAAFEVIQQQSPVEVVDVIHPGVCAALAQTDGQIGVIATEATVASGAYERVIAKFDAERVVHSRACPLLVPIVEEGRSETDPIVTHVLCDYLSDLQRRRVGALILGCTHYPLLGGAIGKLMGPDTLIVSSARATAEEVFRRLNQANLARTDQATGRLECYTTDNPDRFAVLGERFGGRKIDSVEYVGTDELEASPLPAMR